MSRVFGFFAKQVLSPHPIRAQRHVPSSKNRQSKAGFYPHFIGQEQREFNSSHEGGLGQDAGPAQTLDSGLFGSSFSFAFGFSLGMLPEGCQH